jgi:hypothetical protein
VLRSEYLRDHVDALLRLSRQVNDEAASAKLGEMADELRIMLSVADISELVAGLIESPARLDESKRH